ncbi:uncharacterized protein LOC106011958 [Aplysia californica]|uniref:Uncharacterized protein LOC106011958 n=1 Tax=Aplysia californica TaxID=6500 RepID=A0ABM1A196_APLCA|nr:uncharacterized protein LOC106011958 [Aplysia californica]
MDPKAACKAEPAGYTCTCSSDAFFGLKCESTPQGCDHQEESYCICAVDNLPVKFPLPTPTPDNGANTRDVLAGITGIVLGWVLGSLALCVCQWFGCCSDGLCVGGNRRSPRDKPWMRPDSAASTDTMNTSVSSRALTPRQVHPAVGSVRSEALTTNVYRAGFMDDMSHSVSTRKSPSTYVTGARDW